MTSIARDRRKPAKLAKMVERSGLSVAAFDALIERTLARADEVPTAIDTIARVARAQGLALMSHDDPTPEARRHFRALGCAIAEFPTTVAAAEEARDANEWTVFGAPNVLRGGSHTDCPSARDMVKEGLCGVLASDYFYPSLLLAPFVLDAEGIAPLAEAWPLVSEHPAAAVGLEDRGQLNPGMRADIVLVDATGPKPPRVVATLVAGRIIHLSEASRLGS
jgi:alpha-D-ribose 1-methylphosphonate 5-triphosphate diphosphatase